MCRVDSNQHAGLMAAYTFVFYALLSMKNELCGLVKNSVILKGTVSFQASPISIHTENAELPVCQKCTQQTDRQMNRRLFSLI